MTKNYLLLMMNLMIFITLISMMINSLPLNFYIHPILFGLLLIMFCLFLSMNISMYFNTHWFSFIIFLTIISGMMIIFMYFTSFINNMKMNFKFNSIKNLMLLSLTFMILLILFNHFFWDIFISWNNVSDILNLKMISKFNLSNNYIQFNYMYMFNKNNFTIFSMIYLFMYLTIIVKICLKKKFSIRKIN